MLIAAVRMDPAAFTSFSIITLASALAVGGSRAALFQPALIFQRTDAQALVPARYMLVVSSLSALAVGAIAISSGELLPARLRSSASPAPSPCSTTGYGIAPSARAAAGPSQPETPCE